MTPNDAARVLAKAAAVDQRTVGDADVLAWFEILADLDVQDCLDAVKVHYADSTERIMPAHVRRHALVIKRHREYLVRETQETERAAIEAAGRGHVEDRSADVLRLVERVRSVLPEGDPGKLRYATKHWRRVRGRTDRTDDVPNPHFRGWHVPPELPAGEVS